MNWAAFLTIFGLVSISSQLILPNATFFLSSSHIRFFFWLWRRHSTSRCFTDCRPCLHGHSRESKSDTFLEWRNLLSPIFFVRICTISALAALRRPLCISSIFFVGFGQIACSSLPVFSFVQATSHNSEALRSNASLMVARDLPSSCFSDVYPESHSLHKKVGLVFSVRFTVWRLQTLANVTSADVSLYKHVYIKPMVIAS